MHALLRPLAFALPLFLALDARPMTVDITMQNNGNGGIDIKLRPNDHFQDIVSTLVFTIRWDASTDAHLGTISQDAAPAVYLPLIKSDIETDAGGYRYQIFSGMGFTPMNAISAEWNQGQEYTVATIPIQGAASFNVIDDAWTTENNGTFYVALGGEPSTGIIYDLSTGIAVTDGQNVGIDIQPNPADKECVVSIASESARPMDLELFNTAGAVVWSKHVTLSPGRNTETVDLTGFTKGVYMLRLRSDDDVTTRRLVKR